MSASQGHQTKTTPLQPLPVVGLHKHWHMDFIGPIRNGYDGSKYDFLLVDSFSWWPEAFCLPSADAVTVAKVLFKEIFTRYGAPAVLVSDRGPSLCPHWSTICPNFFMWSAPWLRLIIPRPTQLVSTSIHSFWQPWEPMCGMTKLTGPTWSLGSSRPTGIPPHTGPQNFPHIFFVLTWPCDSPLTRPLTLM